MGGEAIKAYQFFLEICSIYPNVTLVTHERCKDQLDDISQNRNICFIPDDRISLFFWKIKILRFMLDLYFYIQVNKNIRNFIMPNKVNILHYICPISPVLPRFPPSNYKSVIGPLNGNIGYPPSFRHREGFKSRFAHIMQKPTQNILKIILGEKKKYQKILVSGYDRTRKSLKWAGASENQLVDVVDSGINNKFLDAEIIVHTGRNPRFVCSGRFIDLKGIDLAIKAVAQAPKDVTLDVFGDGEMGEAWKTLARELGIANRVSFHGWCPHDELMERMHNYRGYLFPSLSDANGIVMQEAMAIGLPVVTLRWGGPEGLADDSAAILIDPKNEGHVVKEITRAISRLADSSELANDIAQNARQIANERFTWSKVCADWARYYWD